MKLHVKERGGGGGGGGGNEFRDMIFILKPKSYKLEFLGELVVYHEA